ncbi:MAG: hypothetical protein HY238_16050 [Acidobacteria bacterium]|nr:hypothetical protein [Acidobacteriota bacterium]
MDVEKAIHFLLEQQAQINEQQGRFNEQQARLKEEQAQFERGLNGLRKLMLVGMKMLVKNERAQARTDAALSALIEAQMRTEARLDRTDARFERLMAALLQKRTNGRG